MFDLDFGDEVLRSGKGSLRMGGVVYEGNIALTKTSILAGTKANFTGVPRTFLESVDKHQPTFLFMKWGETCLRLSLITGKADLLVDDMDGWLKALREPAPAEMSASARLDLGLASGEQRRARYRSVLFELAFPGSFWHVQEHDEALEEMNSCLDDLGIAHLEDLNLDVEDLVDGDNEDAARREQIRRAVAQINARQPEDGPRFWTFKEDIVGFEDDEPVWLWLTMEQRVKLLKLDIVRPL